jgi:DegV family protein with EDD domain
MISQVINFGEESFREGVDIDAAAFMARLRTGKEMPKTAAPYPGDFIGVFQECVTTGESIVCIHPSADVSGTVRSAEIAQKDFPDADIRIIDTRTVAGPLGAIVLEADRVAKQGASADEVEALVRSMMGRARIYFMVDTLEYLRRGGRLGGAQALMGTVLQIKPILTFRDGRVEQFERERTKKKALARIKELIMTESARGAEARISVNHADARQEAEELATDLKQALGAEDVLILDLPPAIVTHAGPGTLAFGFFTPA